MAASSALPSSDALSSPITASSESQTPEVHLPGPPEATRKRLPDERQSITYKFKIASHKGYFTVGLYENGQPGELFIRMAKEGSTISGLLDCFAQAISLGLQYGVPIKLFCDKYAHTQFEPSGYTGNDQIRYAKSIMDYIFRWLELRFVPGAATHHEAAVFGDIVQPDIAQEATTVAVGDGPLCLKCSTIMQRAGSCYYCVNCGHSSGCG